MLPFTDRPSFQLLPEGAVWLGESATLLVADVHFGKSAAFRARGLPVPEGDTERDCQRLLDLARRHGASHLVVAGDLFHASAGNTPELAESLRHFVAELGVPVTLVVGNHDAKIRKMPADIRCVRQLDLGDELRVIHDPAHATGDRIHISGHWHPVVRIADGRRRSLRFPCFLFRNNTLIVPAFGSFTGGATIGRQPGDRFFVTLRGSVIELSHDLFT